MEKKETSPNTNGNQESSAAISPVYYWMGLAKQLGDECMAIHRDATLSAQEKYSKQESLGKALISLIEGDTTLSPEEKDTMRNNVLDYIKGWRTSSE